MQLIVGHIGKAHGIRGEVIVHVRTDEPEARFFPGAVFTTEVSNAPGTPPPGAYRVPEKLTLESLRWHQGAIIAVFDGIHDRNVAEALRSTLLTVDSADVAPPEDPDEYLDHQLVGLRVETVDGETLGEVARIDHAPSSDLIVLRRTGGGTALIPFVKVMVPTVDLDGGRVIVDLPEGLLDL
ncbi:ribosome maturation factor RimM [Spirilliplanes yamanashiensis]|uniref:Ribosome maturation factor RimM n=1 Tax=Spirilliplanes yamanashiensis TaxID=42233 RepID=A0A8J3Y4A4_9ACTN|nr:ribosome maturation factor RimM [Spirilliplanes yamanashiensis]MDP9819704.1 16S rRNA processing protein RimM [Spirilliplanes yamanashiensis]GIJ01476.1 ribosome maturation factor RimM [Spirilliplanes yamanashiensis]